MTGSMRGTLQTYPLERRVTVVTKWIAFVGLFVGMLLIGLAAPGPPAKTAAPARATAIRAQPDSALPGLPLNSSIQALYAVPPK